MTLPPGRKPLDDGWFAKYMKTNPMISNGYVLPTVDRVEIVDNVRGRRYTQHDCKMVDIVFQDGGKTLKIFVEYEPEEEISDD